jgi:hypothetical protein
MRFTGKELLLGLLFAGAAVGVATMGNRETEPYPYLFDRTKATTDQQRFLSAVVAHYNVTESELQPLTAKLRSVWRDLPMIIYVARTADRPLIDISELRRSGKDWIHIYRQLKLPLKPLFEDVPGTSPQPYQAAWTEWRMKYRPELDDEQMRALAELQVARQISGDDSAAIFKQLRKGATIEQVIARAAPESPAAATEEAEKKPSPAARHANSEKKGGARAK